jgi:hypothetical protein
MDLCLFFFFFFVKEFLLARARAKGFNSVVLQHCTPSMACYIGFLTAPGAKGSGQGFTFSYAITN